MIEKPIWSHSGRVRDSVSTDCSQKTRLELGSPGEVQEIVRSLGFYERKARTGVQPPTQKITKKVDERGSSNKGPKGGSSIFTKLLRNEREESKKEAPKKSALGNRAAKIRSRN